MVQGQQPSAEYESTWELLRYAVAESFFSSLKKERIKRKIYATREEAKSEIFEYIEVFYNRTRRHSYLDQLSPVMFEKLQNGT